MVRVIEQPVHRTSIADVIFGAIGLVGILLIVAALCGPTGNRELATGQLATNTSPSLP